VTLLYIDVGDSFEPVAEIDVDRLPVVRALAAAPLRSWIYACMHLRSLEMFAGLTPAAECEALKRIASAARDFVTLDELEHLGQTDTEER